MWDLWWYLAVCREMATSYWLSEEPGSGFVRPLLATPAVGSGQRSHCRTGTAGARLGNPYFFSDYLEIVFLSLVGEWEISPWSKQRNCPSR